jgi:hypothetical protein
MPSAHMGCSATARRRPSLLSGMLGQTHQYERDSQTNWRPLGAREYATAGTPRSGLTMLRMVEATDGRRSYQDTCSVCQTERAPRTHSGCLPSPRDG